MRGVPVILHFPFLLPPYALLQLLLLSCSSIDCPMNNTVYTQYGLYKSNGTADTLKDTLTVITLRHTPDEDPVSLNRSVNTTAMSLPISYQGEEDVFYFVRSYPDSLKMVVLGSDGAQKDTTIAVIAYVTDTVTVAKSDRRHFESIDCTPSFFHTIHEVRHTAHGIDSIVINNPEVNYDSSKEHFHIYFKPRH